MVTVLQFDGDDPEHTFLSPQELAQSLELPLSRITGWRKNGGGPDFVKWGKTVKYRLSDLNRWTEANTFSMTGIRAASPPRRSR